MTKIKFCGLRSIDEVALAASLGAEFAGLVVLAPTSPRELSVEAARELMENWSADIRSVLVTPDTDPYHLDMAVTRCEPDIVQLTGQVKASTAVQLGYDHQVRIWRAFRPGKDAAKDRSRVHNLRQNCHAIVLDQLVDGVGGHGEKVDWDRAHEIVEDLGEFPTVLAGGLTPDNVADAIERVRPWCVDVSTGIESAPGTKDPKMMRSFAEAVRNAGWSP